MKLNRNQIKDIALRVIESEVGGIRWVEILTRIQMESPDTPANTIKGAVQNLLATNENIVKVARGAYQHSKYAKADDDPSCAQEAESKPIIANNSGAESLSEKDFYESFAEWLLENDEVTVASAFGGKGLGVKWGTPDVIGVLKPRAQDIYKFEQQIVTAEIKADPYQPVVAFGQAVAYRLFSHKSYIVVPNSTNQADQNRLKSLCSLHGIGLVTFTLNKYKPDYTFVLLSEKASPDMFYVNQMLDRLKSSEPELLNTLFS